MSEQKYGLGRGLDALLGEDTQTFDLNQIIKEDSSKNTVQYLSINQILPCAYQPRKTFDETTLKDLSESIKQKGVLQPILVRPKGEKYEIIAGERRFRAALDAGLSQIPAIKKELNDAEAFEISLIENIMRENLSPIEEAKGFEKLTETYGYTHEDISKSVGKSRAYISNAVRLLSLPTAVQSLVNDQKLTAGHARQLIGLNNAEEIARKIIQKDLSVRQTESLISKIKDGKRPRNNRLKGVDIKEIEKDLSHHLEVKATLSFDERGRGKIILRYNNFSELENLLTKLEK